MADTAAELHDRLLEAIESLEVAVLDDDGIPGTTEERVRLYSLLRSANWAAGRLTAVTTALEESLGQETQEPVAVDGTLWAAKRVPKRNGYDRPGLRRAVTRWATADRPDPETGEFGKPSTADVIESIWVLAEVSENRTAKLRDAGIDLDEYAVTTWSTRVVEIDPSTIPPDGD